MIRYRSPLAPGEFAEYFSFRWKQLREPLGLPRGSEKDSLEDTAFHIVAYDGLSIIGVGRLHIEADGTARVRYMAVQDDWRHQGVGRSILGRLEQFAHDHQVRICWLLARETAVGFYKKNGYVARGACKSELSSVRHERMEKMLGPA